MPTRAPVVTYPPGSLFTATWWMRTVRYPLIAIVLLVTVAAHWPRGAEASLDDLVADLRAGQVVEVEIGEDSAFGGAVLGGGVIGMPASTDYRVRWRTDNDGHWQAFRTSTQASGGSVDVDESWREPGDASIVLYSGIDPVLNKIADELARTPGGIELYSTRSGAQPAFLPLVVLALWMIVLGTLIHGQQPRWVTKWGWFWLLYVTPYGLGFLALLAVEAPWSRAASSLDPPLPHHEQRRTATGDRRLTAVQAFAVALLASLVVGSIAGALSS